MKQKLSLITTGFIQVYFVSVNTYFLAKEIEIGVLIAAFMISLIWSYNVKRVAFGSIQDRLSYAAGASIGSYLGLKTSSFLVSIIQLF
jgi:hypothetical protein